MSYIVESECCSLRSGVAGIECVWAVSGTGFHSGLIGRKLDMLGAVEEVAMQGCDGSCFAEASRNSVEDDE